MKKNRILAAALALLLLSAVLPLAAYATNYGTLEIASPAAPVAAGESFQLTFSLDGYQSQRPIQYMQLDVAGLDPALVQVTECSYQLPQSETAMAQSASYLPNARLARLVYAEPEGYLAQGGALMTLTLNIHPGVIRPGRLTLPVTMELGTIADGSEKQTKTLTVDYVPQQQDLEQLEITWGAMEFAYSQGTWNPSTHTYQGAGWTDGGTGTVTVKNGGSQDRSILLLFTSGHPDIQGSFGIENQILPSNGEITSTLTLTGKPSGDLDHTVIGTVSIRLDNQPEAEP